MEVNGAKPVCLTFRSALFRLHGWVTRLLRRTVSPPEYIWEGGYDVIQTCIYSPLYLCVLISKGWPAIKVIWLTFDWGLIYELCSLTVVHERKKTRFSNEFLSLLVSLSDMCAELTHRYHFFLILSSEKNLWNLCSRPCSPCSWCLRTPEVFVTAEGC